MAGLRALALVCWIGLASSQIEFDGKSNASATTTTGSPKAASQNDDPPLPPPLPLKASPSDDNPGQTRFAPSFGGSHNFLGPFIDDCQQHCSLSNLQLAHHCCRTRRLCCSLLQAFPGHFPGLVGPAGFPGQVAPPGFLGAAGGKGGACPLVQGLHPGYGGFEGAACVAKCHSDFQCSGQMKCCPAGCSTACLHPEGALFHPAIKPGSCPPTGLLGFLGFRSGPAGADATTPDADATKPDADARRRPEREERRESRRGRPRERSRRSAARLDQQDRLERRRNRLGRRRGRVVRSSDVRERESRRERQRNRKHRVYGRVVRASSDPAGRLRPQRHEATAGARRVARQADPSQRLFLGSHFCRSECLSDLDCPANLKCCSKSKSCNECLSPSYP